MKTAVVYYSGTGNTEAMAQMMLSALEKKADASLIKAQDFTEKETAEYDAFAFGFPAMGADVL